MVNIDDDRRAKFYLTGFAKDITSLDFSPDGTKLVIATGDSQLRIHSGPCWAGYKVFPSEHAKGINQVTFSPDSQFFASASDDGTIKLWNATYSDFVVDPVREPQFEEAPEPIVESVAMTPMPATPSDKPPHDNSFMKSLGSTEKDQNHSIMTFSGHNVPVFSIAISPDQATLASGSVDGSVRLWSIATGALVREILLHTEPIVSVGFSSDASLLMTASWDGYIRFTDVGTGQTLLTLLGAENTAIGNVVFTPDSRHLLVATLDSTIRIWDYVKEKVDRVYTGHKNVKYCLPVKFTPWKTILCPSEDSTNYALYEWDVRTGDIISRKPANNISLALAVHPTSKLVARGGLDKVIMLFDGESLEDTDKHRMSADGIEQHPYEKALQLAQNIQTTYG